jgi:hypothetical protein
VKNPCAETGSAEIGSESTHLHNWSLPCRSAGPALPAELRMPPATLEAGGCKDRPQVGWAGTDPAARSSLKL